MTEAEWLASTHPTPMLDLLEGKVSDRKLMLFSVACFRRIWHLLTDERSRRLVDVTERLVDGWASTEEACNAYNAFYDAYQADLVQDGAGGHTHEAVECVAHTGVGAAVLVASKTAEAVGYRAALSIPLATPTTWSTAEGNAWVSAEKAERTAQAALVRDIFDLVPFRTFALGRSCLSWDDGAVLQQAHAIYMARTFEWLSQLADALEKAGCTDAAILAHCRQPTQHVRGCWVLDLLLGKK
jgi:hypothetical protein